MEKINDKIYSISANMGEPIWAGLNVYLVKSDRGNYLIDAGIPGRACREHIAAEVESVGLTMEDCDIIITHFHPDHIGDVLTLCSPNRKVYMPREAYDFWLKSRTREKVNANLIQDGWPEISHVSFAWVSMFFDFEDPRIVLYDEGDRFDIEGDSIVAIHTPGHTVDEMCLYMEKSKVLFSADHLIFNIVPILEIALENHEILRQYVASVEKLRNYDISLTLPAHFGSGDPYKRIDEVLAHIDRKLERTYETFLNYSGEYVSKNPGKGLPKLSAYEVSSLICGTPDFSGCDTINSIVKARMPIQALIPYVFELALRGKLNTEVENGVIKYSIAEM